MEDVVLGVVQHMIDAVAAGVTSLTGHVHVHIWLKRGRGEFARDSF